MFLKAPLGLDVDKIYKDVLGLKDLWIQRHLPGFYTLGPCAYLDLDSPAYYKGKEKTNPVLLETFPEMYQAVQDYLEGVIGEEVWLDPDVAHPSFHIFESNPCYLKQSGTWHQDRPNVTLGLGEVDPLTFTVAIKLPKSGGGMDYTLTDGSDEIYYGYEEGSIVVHSGFVYHRISKLKEYVEGEHRITLQGHIIRKNGKLIMYW